MKHVTPAGKMILSVTCLFLVASLSVRAEESTHESSSPATIKPAELTPSVNPAFLPSTTGPKWSIVMPAAERSVEKTSWVRAEPGALSVPLRMDPSVAPPNFRYGAVPAIVNLNFGHK